jgi:hypothetical protein
MYFKACLEVGRKKKDERIMYISARDIVHAMEITKKIRWSTYKYVKPVSYDEYMKGVALKYRKEGDQYDVPKA